MNFNKVLIVLVFLLSSTLFAQKTNSEDAKLSLKNSTVENQFEYVIKKSTGWNNEFGQAYRVVKTDWLNQLKAHTLDTLQAIKNDLVATKNTLKTQNKQISDLNKKLSNAKFNIDKIVNDKEKSSFFGIKIANKIYIGIMWFIVFALITLIALMIYKFKNSNATTQLAKQKLVELEEVFEEHRKTSLEREQKVRRQLLDEINKQKIIKTKK